MKNKYRRDQKKLAPLKLSIACKQGTEGPRPSKCSERGVIPAPRLLVGAAAPNPGCFAAARPGGRLSLAAGAAVLLSIVVEE